ncbi:MAG: hypothetical protein WCA13_06240 [Terriglobales bacterium]
MAKKSLDGTKEALDELRAYLGRALADAVKPTVQRIIQNSVQLDGALNLPPDAILEEFRGENFQDDVSSFVTSDLDAMISYRMLIHARDRWSKWAQRISWGVYIFLALEFVFTIWFGLANRVFNHPVSLPIAVFSLSVSGIVFGYCILCAGVMLRCHDKISTYRDKVL